MLKAVVSKKVLYTSTMFLQPSKYARGFYFIKWHIYRNYTTQNSGIGILRHLEKAPSTYGAEKYKDKFIDGGTAIIQQASSAKSIREIFDLIQNNVEHMSGRECVAVLHALYVVLHEVERNINVEDIRNRKEIIELSYALKRQIRMIPLMDVIAALKVFSFLKTPTSSFMYQSLLQMTAKMANDLTVGQILLVDQLMKDMAPCPLIDALKIALPIVFNSAAKADLNSRKIYTLINMFHYSVSNDIDSEVLDAIIRKLTLVKDIFYLQTNVAIVQTFLSLNTLDDSYLELYDYCLQKVAADLNAVSLNDVLSVINMMANQFVSGENRSYNEEFLHAVVYYVFENKLSFESSAYILRSLNTMNFVNSELLDYMDSLLLSYDSFPQIKFPELFALYLNGLSIAFYKPKHWNIYKDKLVESLYEHKYYANYSIARVTYDLICLDYWDDKLIEFVFSGNFQQLNMKDEEENNDRVKICQAVATLYPGGYKNSLPANLITENEFDKLIYNKDESSLLSALEYCLGGSDYVLSRVYTKYGQLLDYVIVLQNDCPVRIDDNIKQKILSDSGNIDGSTIADGYKLISVLPFDHPYTCINVNKLTGHAEIRIRSLECSGVKPVAVILAEWEDLPDCDKISFLRRKLDDVVKCVGDDGEKNMETATV